MKKYIVILGSFALLTNAFSAYADENAIDVDSWDSLKKALSDSTNVGKIVLLQNDFSVAANNSISSVVNNATVIDGNGHIITGANNSSEAHFLKLSNSPTKDLIIQNISFDGLQYSQSSAMAYGAVLSNMNSQMDIFSGNFSNNSVSSETKQAIGGVVYLDGAINTISGLFEKNSTYSAKSSSGGGAIFNSNIKASGIDKIDGTFIDNEARSDTSYVMGGAIYNSGNVNTIAGDFVHNQGEAASAFGGGLYNAGRINSINADFSNNTVKGSTGFVAGGAIYNEKGTIGNLIGDFENNFAYSSSNSYGGAIYNYNNAQIDNIVGNFTGNYAKSGLTSKSSAGGAIFNSNSIIRNISGDFEGNYAISSNGQAVQGGAIFNASKELLTLTNSSFYNNYIQTSADKDSLVGKDTQGGAILTQTDLKIAANDGKSVFSGNKVIWGDATDSSAIFFSINNDINANLYLDSQNNGLIQFDDKIASISVVQNFLKTQQNKGYEISKNDDGGYTLKDSQGKVYIIEKKDKGSYWIPMQEMPNMSQTDVKNMLSSMPSDYKLTQVGDDYFAQNSSNLIKFIKQDNGTYNLIKQKQYSGYGGNIVVTGDKSSKVVFNNTIEEVAKIDISGTNVDVNEGAGTVYRTVTHDDGVLNINADAKAEDNIVNSGGTMHVASGGMAQDTTVNSGGKLEAETQAKLNNMLANGGAILDIDSGAVLIGNIVIHADAEMGGSYDYSQIFKDEVTDKGSLTLVGGLNNVLNESSLINNTDAKNLYLTLGDYQIGEGTQSVLGWNMLALKDNANVKLEGDIALSGPNKKLIIENGSTIDLSGHSPSNYQIVGSVSNDGMMNFTHPDDGADDVTTIYGNYKAYTNAKMTIDVDPINNVSDLLKIEGDVEGKTDVILNSINYNGKPTQLIKYVEALNDNPDTGASFDIYRVQNSAYDWNSKYIDGAWYTGTTDLISDDAQSGYGNVTTGNLEDDVNLEEDAVLPLNFPDVPEIGERGNKKPSVVGEAIAYMGLPSAGIEQTRDMSRNVANKVALSKVYSQACHGFYDCEYNGSPLRNAWAAPVYSYSDVKAPYSFEAEISGFEGGFDIQSDAYNRLGVFGSYRQGSYDFDGNGDDYYSKVGADMDIDSYILGLYHRYDEGKKWLMSQIFLGYQDVSLSTKDGVSSSTDGIEFGGAIEGGLIFNPLKDLTVEPSLRLAYTQINYDDATDNYGKTAKYDDVRNIEVEAGVKVEKTYLRKEGYAKVYVKPSIIQNIGSGDVTVTSLNKVDGLDNATLGRLEIGGSMSFDEKWSGYANTSYTFGSDYTNAAVNLGLNYAF